MEITVAELNPKFIKEFPKDLRFLMLNNYL